MNWIQFMQTIGAAYLCYYVLIILFEMRRRRKQIKHTTADMELTFEQEEHPRHISTEELDAEHDKNGKISDEKPVTTLSATGINMNSLVDMAKANVGDYTRNIPY
jgi:Ca2+/H+ antiporter